MTAATIASWVWRADEEEPGALVQLREPVNKFPDCVRYVVQRLKAICPTMGKKKIAETLARAGLHLGATTVGRMLGEKPRPTPSTDLPVASAKPRVVTAKYPGHLWHVDLTMMPTMLGFWTSWLPFSLPQRWPFAWWIGLAQDHFSRRLMGFAVFRKEPSSDQVRCMLGRAIAAAGKPPRYIVCDKGPQFFQPGFKRWCRRKGIKPPRYGAVGKHGSLAVIERAILTTKQTLRRLPLVPLRAGAFRREVAAVVGWHNEYRPHTALRGRTPNEVYLGRRPANRRPRLEPRAKWPRGSPCARPQVLVRGQPGAEVQLAVTYLQGRKHLPIVRVQRAA